MKRKNSIFTTLILNIMIHRRVQERRKRRIFETRLLENGKWRMENGEKSNTNTNTQYQYPVPVPSTQIINPNYSFRPWLQSCIEDGAVLGRDKMYATPDVG
jgi:hypothetical protein